MSKTLKFSSLLAILLVAALLLSACSMFGGTTGQSQVLHLMAADEPPVLDSAISTDNISFTVLGNVMEGLYTTGKDGNPVLGMAAAEPTVSKDQLTYTFKIRDAKWSDGKAVTANDFVYAWKRVLDPKTVSTYSYIMDPIKGATAAYSNKGSLNDVGIKALDDKTFQVTLATPTPWFKSLLAFPVFLPQRQDIVEKYGSNYAKEANTMVYNGPFVLSSWQHNQGFTYKKNEGYWDAANVKLSEVDVTILKDPNTMMNLYNTGKLDYVDTLAPAFIDAYKNKPDFVTVKEVVGTYLQLNEKSGPNSKLFSNANIRNAITLAIDKDTLNKDVLKSGIAAGGVVPPGIATTSGKEFRSMSDLPAQYDAAKAKQLWTQGLAELKMSAPASIELLGDNTPVPTQIEQYIQAQLQANLGVKVVIDTVPFKDRLARSTAGQFDMVLFNWGADYNDPMTFLNLWTSDSTFNDGHWSNAQYDALVKKSETNTNFDQRTQDLIAAEKILVSESGIVPIRYRSHYNLVRPSIKDMVFYAFGPTYGLKWMSVSK